MEGFELENLLILPFFGGGHHDDGDVKDGDGHGGHPEFTVGLFTALEIPREDGISDGALEIGPVIEAEVGPVEWVGNFLFEIPFADGEDAGFAYASQIVYPLNDTIGIGVENFGEFEGAFGGDAEQEHFVGPAVYFEAELPNGHVLEPRAAVLFGIGDDAPDAILSLNLEYKFGGK